MKSPHPADFNDITFKLIKCNLLSNYGFLIEEFNHTKKQSPQQPLNKSTDRHVVSIDEYPLKQKLLHNSKLSGDNITLCYSKPWVAEVIIVRSQCQ